ncbi:MAG: hypothetical protein ACI4VR_01375 [Bacilli bacterium]
MNIIKSISNFYQNLSTSELVLIWVVITIFFILLFICINLMIKVKKLRKIIKNLNEEKKINIVKTSDIDFNNIKLIKESKQDLIVNKEQTNLENTGIYQKNMLKEIGTKDQTSPVSIGKGNDVISLAETQKLTPIDISKYNLDETLYQDLEEEETPIEFTDFERQGEEDAIISYEELIKNTHLAATREERFNTEIEDDSEFLKELKSFRKGM